MAAQRHKSGDDGRLPITHAAHHHSTVVLCGLAGLQDIFQMLKEPISAHKHRICGDAGNLEQQRFEHDVHGFVGSKTRWRKREKKWNRLKLFTLLLFFSPCLREVNKLLLLLNARNFTVINRFLLQLTYKHRHATLLIDFVRNALSISRILLHRRSHIHEKPWTL